MQQAGDLPKLRVDEIVRVRLSAEPGKQSVAQGLILSKLLTPLMPNLWSEEFELETRWEVQFCLVVRGNKHGSVWRVRQVHVREDSADDKSHRRERRRRLPGSLRVPN